MSCPEPSLLQVYLEGAATADERDTLRLHLEECDSCRELVLTLAPDQVDEEAPTEASLAGAGNGVATIGAAIGRYVVLRKLGEGGMGVVYAAYDPELDRKIALKLIRPDSAGATGEVQERLLREAQAMARIAHPNVVAAYDVGRHGAQVFVAMELIDGETLGEWLKQKPRSSSEIVDVFVRAGRGLCAAHAVGLVHRDFKPNNVMIDRQGRVRVTDFGLARPAGRSDGQSSSLSPSRLDHTLTASGVLLGTPAYMAPEQLAKEPSDARTDQFSFCVALYEALCGTRPFVADDSGSMHAAIVAEKLERPKRKVAGWLLGAVERGLSAKPDARWPSLEALLFELGRDPSRWRRRVLGALGVMVLLAVGALAYRKALVAQQSLCTGAERKLAGVWDGARKEALRQKLAPGDADDRLRLETALDGYSRRWVQHRTEACEDTRVRGENSEQVLELRMECLDQRLLDLDAFVSTIAASPELLSQAVGQAHTLPALAECDNVVALRNLDRSTLPPQVIQPLDKELALARSHANLFSHASAAETDPLITKARAAGAWKVLSRALRIRALVEERSGQLQMSFATLREAAIAAAAQHDDVGFADALSRLALEEGSTPAELADAEVLAEYAKATSERIGRPAQLEWRIRLATGGIAWRKGKLEAAIVDVRAAIERMEHDPDASSVDVAGLQSYLAGILHEAGHTDEAAALRRLALESMESVLGPHAPPVLINKMQAAIAEFDADHVEAAIGLDRQLVDDYAHIKLPQPTYQAYALNNLGWDLVERSPEEALPLLERARAQFEKLFGADAVDNALPLTGIGLALLGQGRAHDAVLPLEQALGLRDTPALRETVERAETELALARALDSGARALALARHGREVLAAHPLGARRARLIREADAWLAKRAH